MNKITNIFVSVILVVLCGDLFADENEAEKWDVNNPPYPTHEISLDVTSGTWMNLDVSSGMD